MQKHSELMFFCPLGDIVLLPQKPSPFIRDIVLEWVNGCYQFPISHSIMNEHYFIIHRKHLFNFPFFRQK